MDVIKEDLLVTQLVDCKCPLKVRYYGRYVDDMILVHSNKQTLLDAIEPNPLFTDFRFWVSISIHIAPIRAAASFA